MTKVIKLRRGLNISLAGRAELRKLSVPSGDIYALMPEDFVGVKPKVVVKEGDKIKAGDALFVNKEWPEVKFASPVSGTVVLVERGERRKLLSVRIEADAVQEFRDFTASLPPAHSPQEGKGGGNAVVTALLEAGLFGYINQLPYAISTNPSVMPRAIFVSALRDMPLAGDFEFELEGNEEDFQAGLSALSKIAKTYLGIGAKQSAKALTDAKDVEVVVFDGKCPAGNVGIQINHIAPVNKGEVVWTVEPTAVIFFGRLFRTGKVNLRRTVALAGSEVKEPCYADMLVGQSLAGLLEGRIKEEENVRVINGNPLTGRLIRNLEISKSRNLENLKNVEKIDNLEKIDNGGNFKKAGIENFAFLGAHTSEITVIPEGDHADELAGWIMPRLNQFSVNRSYFSWLFGKKDYRLDARVKGGERHIIMSGEYDSVLPMDIYGEYLIKAIIAKDIDKMEQLGIYEVSPEDFALAEFVDSSKLELQQIVREGLDMLRKEN